MIKTMLSLLLSAALSLSPAHAEQNAQQKTKSLETRILEQATTAQVVMFGEDHVVPWDNVYVTQLLPKLKEKCFTYLAIEYSRWGGIHALVTQYRKHRLSENMFKRLFLKETEKIVYGDDVNITAYTLISTAYNLGMTVFCYDGSFEWSLSGWIIREKQSYANLHELIFDKDKNARVIVYCGAHHLSENTVVCPLPFLDGSIQERTVPCLGMLLSQKYNTLTVNLATPVPHVDISASEEECKQMKKP